MKVVDGGPQIATANRRRDGAVVFLRADDAWSTDLREARVAAGPDEAHELTRTAEDAVKGARVVGPYLIAVARTEGRWTPLNYRERIRADGPSLDLPRVPARSAGVTHVSLRRL